MTVTVVSTLWVYARVLPLPRQARTAVNLLLGAMGLQASLGISTLIYMVPIPLASAHQAGSLTLLTAALWLIHTTKRLPIRM
jgi:cytochrome c oxidase assembly protein subunit 15